MQERKLRLGLVGFPYSGSGGGNAETSDIRNWMIPTIQKAKADPRIEPDIWHQDYNDTPITMMRNRAVVDARKAGVDVLVMVDADMRPDCELGFDPEAQPFFETSFDFIYSRWDKGPHVVCAPYCGPPPDENVYVFYWRSSESFGQNVSSSIEMYTREHAATMSGIQPCAAQPTGLIMFDMRAFDLTDPKPMYDALIEQGLSHQEAVDRVKGWFYYETGDIYHSTKCSTEDVTATRDISFHGLHRLGYSPIYCNWDAWAGHHKAKVVRKPRVVFADSISQKYQHAVLSAQKQNVRRMHMNLDLPTPVKPVIDQTPRGMKPDLVRVGDMCTPKQDLEALRDIAAMVSQDVPYAPEILEVGSWVGESALALKDGAPRSAIMCVDTWEGSASDRTIDLANEAGGDAVYEAFLANTKGLDIEPYRQTSLEMAKAKWHKLDLIHIDAEHTYDAVLSDIKAWWPHLRDGGVMSFHDFNAAGFPDVTAAIRDCFGHLVTYIPGTVVAWVRKNDETTRTLEGCQAAVACCNEGSCQSIEK